MKSVEINALHKSSSVKTPAECWLSASAHCRDKITSATASLCISAHVHTRTHTGLNWTWFLPSIHLRLNIVYSCLMSWRWWRVGWVGGWGGGGGAPKLGSAGVLFQLQRKSGEIRILLMTEIYSPWRTLYLCWCILSSVCFCLISYIIFIWSALVVRSRG